jgi:hypothetical protein
MELPFLSDVATIAKRPKGELRQEALTMEKTIEAVFDGKVFHPEGHVDLEPNKPYVLLVTEKKNVAGFSDAWGVLDRLTGTVDGPEDWAQEHDHYLYGSPKRNKKRS